MWYRYKCDFEAGCRQSGWGNRRCKSRMIWSVSWWYKVYVCFTPLEKWGNEEKRGYRVERVWLRRTALLLAPVYVAVARLQLKRSACADTADISRQLRLACLCYSRYLNTHIYKYCVQTARRTFIHAYKLCCSNTDISVCPNALRGTSKLPRKFWYRGVSTLCGRFPMVFHEYDGGFSWFSWMYVKLCF